MLKLSDFQVSSVKTHGVSFFEELVNKLCGAFWTSHEPAIDDNNAAMAAFRQPTLLQGASDLFHMAKVPSQATATPKCHHQTHVLAETGHS